MPDRVLAELVDEHALIRAIARMRQLGYVDLEVYMPFPSLEVEDALDRPRSRLPYVIAAVGLGAAAGAYTLQWLLVGVLYPLVVGGRPPHFPLGFVPITFEMGVLFASFTAFFGVLLLGRLVRLNDAVQNTPGFESVTTDRFWLEVRTIDWRAARDHLIAIGARRVEQPEGAP
jgi:Alternative complex III, ActD subunit